jgi:hypothetical protein
MPDAATFLTELEAKNHDSFRNLASGYVTAVTKENFQVADLLRLEMKSVIETIEVAALWLPDAETLALKMALATRCGDGARHLDRLAERLAALGVPLGPFDPRQGGYSKLFAFLRSLQTIEERTSAGFMALGTVNLLRFESLAIVCDGQGDNETARLYREQLIGDEQRHVTVGKQMLVEVVTQEESQARARRAAFRTVELLGELQDPGLMRKFLRTSLRK